MQGLRRLIQNHRMNKANLSSRLSWLHDRVLTFAQPKSNTRPLNTKLRQVLNIDTFNQRPSTPFTPHTSFVNRTIHMSNTSNKEIGYSEYLNLQKRGLTVVDVREVSEIKASGTIPGSLNIPLKQVNYALSKSANDFKAKYGRSKPSENEHMLFLCQKGVRSRNAMEKAIQLGYSKALTYRGGWEDFSRNSKK